MLKQKDAVKETEFYFIYIRLEEKARFFQSVISGYKTGAEGFYYAVKYTIIIIMFLVPLFVILMLIRLFYAFVKWQWKSAIFKIENLIGKSTRNNVNRDK